MANNDPYTPSVQTYPTTTDEQNMRTEDRIPWQQQAIGAGGCWLASRHSPGHGASEGGVSSRFPVTCQHETRDLGRRRGSGMEG